jgi:hypothetical protein
VRKDVAGHRQQADADGGPRHHAAKEPTRARAARPPERDVPPGVAARVQEEGKEGREGEAGRRRVDPWLQAQGTRVQQAQQGNDGDVDGHQRREARPEEGAQQVLFPKQVRVEQVRGGEVQGPRCGHG